MDDEDIPEFVRLPKSTPEPDNDLATPIMILLGIFLLSFILGFGLFWIVVTLYHG